MIMELMRVKIDSKLLSHDGHKWKVKRIDRESGLVELENEHNVRFHVHRSHLKGHAKKVGFFSRLFGRGKI
jgi:hypothetical protein